MFSAVLIIPEALRNTPDVALPFDCAPTDFTVPVSDSDDGTVTHYAARMDVADPVVGPIPEGMIVDLSPDPANSESPSLWGEVHFNAVLAANGMTIAPR